MYEIKISRFSRYFDANVRIGTVLELTESAIVEAVKDLPIYSKSNVGIVDIDIDEDNDAADLAITVNGDMEILCVEK